MANDWLLNFILVYFTLKNCILLKSCQLLLMALSKPKAISSSVSFLIRTKGSSVRSETMG